MELIIDNINKTYANGVQALSGVSLRIPTGMYGLLGPNGAGKTTTIRMILGLLKPSQGEASIAGFTSATAPEEVVKTHFKQIRGRSVAGQMPAQFAGLVVSLHHHGHRIPPQDVAQSALYFQVAGIVRLLFR